MSRSCETSRPEVLLIDSLQSVIQDIAATSSPHHHIASGSSCRDRESALAGVSHDSLSVLLPLYGQYGLDTPVRSCTDYFLTVSRRLPGRTTKAELDGVLESWSLSVIHPVS